MHTVYSNQLNKLRRQIRSGSFRGNTSGLMPNLVQGNVVVLAQQWADEFIAYCNNNPKPCPIIGVSAPGNPALPTLGEGLDIRFEVPQYQVYRDGQLAATASDINAYWQDDSVAIVLGCSFSFEEALQAAGIAVRNIELGRNVSMFDTHIPTHASQHFAGNMVVTMRPFKPANMAEVVRITAQFPKAHGAPIHIGDPSALGIDDLNTPQYGAAVALQEGDIAAFWACGVTTQKAVVNAKLPLVITHAPGKMLITDKSYAQLV